MGQILIVDDEGQVGRMLERSLRGAGFIAKNCEDPEVALRLLKEEPFEIVVSDLRMPGIDGIELLRRAKRIRPSCEVVLMTAYATVQTAREALKLGAADFITKPFSVDGDLMPLLRDLLDGDEDVAPTPENESDAKPHPLHSSAGDLGDRAYDQVIGRGPTMQALLEKTRRVAQSDSVILLRGESGSGKEVIANLSCSLSSRSKGPLIKINCAALPESLLESELFGYRKGAFTGATQDREGLFEAADGGTLLLDEIGEISPAFQPKLLRVLQEGEFYRVGDARKLRRTDVRIIASTNRNLEEAVEQGAFRQDLYYRLCVLPLHLPPLREHMEDLPDLLEHLIKKLGKGRRLTFEPGTLEVLQRYPWPGNIRELASAVEYALVMGEGDVIGMNDLPVAIQDFERQALATPHSSAEDAGTLEVIEQRCILQALDKTGNNRTQAANLLGISRRTLGYRIAKYGLEQKIVELVAPALAERPSNRPAAAKPRRRAGEGTAPRHPTTFKQS